MAVLRFREAAEETETRKSATWGVIEPGYMSDELTEDGAPNASFRQLPAPGTIATNDLAAKLAAADAAISTFKNSFARSGPATTSCVGPWTTSSGTATSGAGGPSGPSSVQSGRGGTGWRAEWTDRLRRPYRVGGLRDDFARFLRIASFWAGLRLPVQTL
jgi:hypothetical protein